MNKTKHTEVSQSPSAASTTTPIRKLVGFWRRWTGLLADTLIILAIGLLISAILGQNPYDPNFGSWQAVLDIVLTYAMMIAYTIGFLWLNHGQTPGMQLVGIQLQKDDGQRLTFPTVLLRWLGSLLSSFVINLGYLWCAWDDKKQTWHDKIAGTVVLEKKSRPLGLLVVLFVALYVVLAVHSTYAFVSSFRKGWEQGTKLSEEIKQLSKESELDDYETEFRSEIPSSCGYTIGWPTTVSTQDVFRQWFYEETPVSGESFRNLAPTAVTNRGVLLAVMQYKSEADSFKTSPKIARSATPCNFQVLSRIVSIIARSGT